MDRSVGKLLSISSEPIEAAIESGEVLERFGRVGCELAAMLKQRNGFYSFESALLVRPLSSVGLPLGIVQWNEPALWRHEYEQDFSGVLFFAEDVLGVQFCIRGDVIRSFDPETGIFKSEWSSLDSWASEILAEYQIQTGYSLAHDWQLAHGAIPAGSRLMPGQLFVLGGKFEVGNLRAIGDVAGMCFRGAIARQIRDVPDGGKIRIVFEEDVERGG